MTLGLVASLAFATAGPLARTMFDLGWTPGAAVLWRTVGGGVVLLPLAAWSLRRRWRLVLREWRLVIAFGALGVVTAQTLFFAAVSRMSVGLALLIEYTAPVALVIWAWLRRRSVPSAFVQIGSVLAVLGLLFVLDLAGATPDVLGLLFAGGSMVGAAGYFVLSARPSELPPVALASIGLLAGSLGLAGLVASGFLPYAAPLGSVRLMGQVVPWWVAFAALVVISTAVAYGLGIVSIGFMGERLGSFVSLSEVIFATMLAAAALGEVPRPIQVTGGILILCGVVVIRLAGNRPSQSGPPYPADHSSRQRASQAVAGIACAPHDSGRADRARRSSTTALT